MFFPMSASFTHYKRMPIGLTLGFLSGWRPQDSIFRAKEIADRIGILVQGNLERELTREEIIKFFGVKTPSFKAGM